MKKLFEVSSVVNDFQYRWGLFDKVSVWWVIIGREAPVVPYEQAIKDYRKDPDGNHHFPEAAVDEFFTEDEASALREYLLRAHGLQCEVKEVVLPIKWNTAPFGCVGIGGGTGCWELDEGDGYGLPFKVCGYYDAYAGKVVNWRRRARERWAKAGEVDDEIRRRHGNNPTALQALEVAEEKLGLSHPGLASYLDWAAQYHIERDEYNKLTLLFRRIPAGIGVMAGVVGDPKRSHVIVERAPFAGGLFSLGEQKVAELKPKDRVEVICTLDDLNLGRLYSSIEAVDLTKVGADVLEGDLHPARILGLENFQSVRFHPSAIVRGKHDPWDIDCTDRPAIIVWDAWLLNARNTDNLAKFLSESTRGKKEKEGC